MKTFKAFTLQELLIVLVIVGILMLLALPNFTPLINRAKSTEAKIQLQHLAKLQESFFMIHSRYSEDFQEISFMQEPLVTESGNANYKIEILSADQDGFEARATSVVDFDRDGVLNIWSVSDSQAPKEIQMD